MSPDLVVAAENTESIIHSQPVPTVIEKNIERTAETAAAAVPIPVRATDEAAVESSTSWLSLIWLCGTLLAFVPLVSGLLGNLRLKLRSRRLDDSDWQRTLTNLCDNLGLQRKVSLLLGGPQQMPMTFGIWKPCVMLPDEAQHWSEERKQIVLLHELAHVKRYDVPLQMIARFACILFWFHPLVWWSARRMRLEREHACDDFVLLAGQEASDYASELLEIAHGHRSCSGFRYAALCMARKSQLEGRLLAVLDTQRCRTQVSAARAGGLFLLAVALVAGLGVIRPTLQAEVLSSATENDSPSADRLPEAKTRNQLIVTGTVLSPQGKPVPSAVVEVIAYHLGDNWRRHLPREDKIDYYKTQTDDSGRFRLAIPRNISRPRNSMQVIASTADGLLTWERINPRLTPSHLELKLNTSKEVRLQLIDTAGNPVTGVQPQLGYFGVNSKYYLNLRHSDVRTLVTCWPRFSRSDKEGYVSIKVPVSTKQLSLYIDDNRIGSHNLQVDISSEPVSVALQPAQFLNGKVTDAENGKPITGAEIVLIERPYRRVRTNADGSFRIARGTPLNTLFPSGESIMQVYPPPESDLLFQAFEWKWPNDGIGDAKLSIKLLRGIVVEGRVVEKETGKPVSEVALYFDPQRKNNPLFNKSSVSRFLGSDMKYITDANGRFRMPVWPGPGYLLLNAPMLDYVHVQVSMGERWYGKPGLWREYHDGALKLNLKPGEKPQPLKIELQRGITLRRKVVRPDGQPAGGKAYARSYLQYEDRIKSSLPEIPIEDGLLELPGFDPEKSVPLFLIDFEHHCGAIVSSINPDGPAIQLQKCGSAKFRFENNKGEVLADFKPRLLMIVTPGVTATHHIQPDQPLWAESIIWDNIVRPGKVPKTDADGRVTVNDLIPGATYRLQFISKKGLWDNGYEFTVRSGETTDVGKVVLFQRN
ncbi:MAG: hypothetical protein IID46_09945 [Planctomycetes bacterium]|nr:hypothetical protein [Planctomycetota bacterium]